MLHDITIRMQVLYTNKRIWRLSLLRCFATHCQKCRWGRYQRCSPVAAERITDMNFQPREISEQGLKRPASYKGEIEAAEVLLRTKETWNGITAEAVARMRLQNRFKTGLD